MELRMYGRRQRVLLRHYLEQGLSKTDLAEQLGISRRTVYHWVATGQLDRELDNDPVRYRPRPTVERKVDRFRGLLEARLAEFPRLSAVRLFEEVRAAGYSGGYTQLRLLVRQLRPSLPVDPVVRFETPAGWQAQVDFAEFKLPWGKRHALVVVLGYSRLLWLHFFERQTLAVLMRGLEEAFRFFGGVPAELLFDQLKAVIIEDQRGDGGKLVENPEFLRFAAHWGFRIRACRPYRARTKGKVERPISYVRQGFFYARQFLNDDDLNAQAHTWLTQTANRRLHRTLGEAPEARFEREERALLKPLAARPYRSLVIQPTPRPPAQPAGLTGLPSVERRPLSDYDRIAGGAA
jgi:transposase